MKSLTFTVPLVPPSVNTYVRHARGRHYKTTEAKAFAQAVHIFAVKELGSENWPLHGTNFRVSALVSCRNRKSADVDNYLKLILDSLVDAGVLPDDRYVSEVSIRKQIAADQYPFTKISVVALDGTIGTN